MSICIKQDLILQSYGIHELIQIYICSCIHTYIHACILACAHTYMHSYIHMFRYDAVNVNGDLKHQDTLTALNKPYFDCCDGIFINYTWEKEDPLTAVALLDDIDNHYTWINMHFPDKKGQILPLYEWSITSKKACLGSNILWVSLLT